MQSGDVLASCRLVRYVARTTVMKCREADVFMSMAILGMISARFPNYRRCGGMLDLHWNRPIDRNQNDGDKPC